MQPGKETQPPARGHPAWPPRPGRSAVLLGSLAFLGLLAAGLLTARLATLAPIAFALDDPGLQADGFYPPETSTGGVRFRWSRPNAGFLLPALAARQVYTIELTVPR